MPVHFFADKIDFQLASESTIESWILQIVQPYKREIKELNYIFCPDEYLLKINQEYLSHNYYTDIITFDHSDANLDIEGDVFISIDRVKENADINDQDFDEELSRAMAHGLLHLLGYKDKTRKEKKEMKEKEDTCLSLQKQ